MTEKLPKEQTLEERILSLEEMVKIIEQIINEISNKTQKAPPGYGG